MAKQIRTLLTSDRFTVVADRDYFSQNAAGSITANPAKGSFMAPVAGRITNVWLSVGNNGVDNTNPLSLSVTATNLRTGLAVTSTGPAISKTAAAGAFVSTLSAGTGITQSVINPANALVNAGDQIQFTWTLTRTASPGTEIQDAVVTVEVSELADFDPLKG